MDIEKLVRVWRSPWEVVVDEQGATPLFGVNNEF